MSTTVNAGCADCVRLGSRCEGCQRWDRLAAQLRPEWERRRTRAAERKQRREQRRQELFAQWGAGGEPPRANIKTEVAPKKEWVAGADKALPPSDRD